MRWLTIAPRAGWLGETGGAGKSAKEGRASRLGAQAGASRTSLERGPGQRTGGGRSRQLMPQISVPTLIRAFNIPLEPLMQFLKAKKIAKKLQAFCVAMFNDLLDATTDKGGNSCGRI